jgi:hypothetical protein
LSESSEPKPRPPEISPLLESLHSHEVDFVVIGGLAGIAHGSAYPTYDLDIAYGRDAGNQQRLVDALGELDVTLRGAPPDLPFQLDVKSISNGANFTFETKYGSLDVLGHVAGVNSFEELRSAARLEQIGGVAVRVASIDHLIAMKRAANRPKDQLMLEEYLVIADEQERAAREGSGTADA